MWSIGYEQQAEVRIVARSRARAARPGAAPAPMVLDAAAGADVEELRLHGPQATVTVETAEVELAAKLRRVAAGQAAEVEPVVHELVPQRVADLVPGVFEIEVARADLDQPI